MNMSKAMMAVDQILNEERVRPTIGYEDIANEWVKRSQEMTSEEIAAWMKITSIPRTNLWAQRQESPRQVTETPHIFRFSGTNFDLLMSVYTQITENERPQLVGYILQRVSSGGRLMCRKPANYAFPTFSGNVCELPLVAEFCVRTGNIKEIFLATANPMMPTPALATMIMQLEETIALNWDLFSDEQLEQIPVWLAGLRQVADRQTHGARSGPDRRMIINPHYVMGHEVEANQIVKSIDGIASECEQARFWYLKGALQRTVNLELESDKVMVENFLAKLGFSDDMVKALNAAELDYRSTTNPFELKSCLGHLRSFLEHLHREAVRSIASAAGNTVTDRWGDATTYLCQQGYFSKQHEAFVTSLYTLISDESVHPLGADREYARLIRNVVIEYGVMFLAMLSKENVRVN
jgi:hypothetical protein